jgi:hypothetical protein
LENGVIEMENEKKEETIEEIFERHRKFIENVLKENGEIYPQVSYQKNGEVIAMVLLDLEREKIKAILDRVSETRPEWVCYMTEGFAKRMLKEDRKEVETSYRQGELQERFSVGDKSVQKVIIVQVYKKSEKRAKMYDKEMHELVSVDDFQGFLTIDDVKRVFW